MNKDKIVKIIIISVIIIIIFVTAFLLITRVYLPGRIPSPKSDIPITRKIGWWPYQNLITVESLNIVVIYNKLDTKNNKALVEYQLSGQLLGEKDWKPRVSMVHIAENWTLEQQKTGKIIITPIVSYEHIKGFNKKVIPFNIKVQDYLGSGTWGKNFYNVMCNGQKKQFVLFQSK